MVKSIFIFSYIRAMNKRESKLQAEFFKETHNMAYFRYCVWSTPNGMFLNGNWGVINEMKATGALKGVWDLTVQKKGKLFFIETKVGSNGLTKEQKHFRDVRIANGVPKEHFFIFKTIEEGRAIRNKIMEICGN